MHKADTYDRYRKYLSNKAEEFNQAGWGSFTHKGRGLLLAHLRTMGDISPKEMLNNEVISMELYHSYCIGYVEGYLAAKAEILTGEGG